MKKSWTYQWDNNKVILNLTKPITKKGKPIVPRGRMGASLLSIYVCAVIWILSTGHFSPNPYNLYWEVEKIAAWKKEEYFENDLNTMRGVLKEKNKRGIWKSLWRSEKNTLAFSSLSFTISKKKHVLDDFLCFCLCLEVICDIFSGLSEDAKIESVHWLNHLIKYNVTY